MHSLDFEEFLWAKGYSEEQVEDLYRHMDTLTPFSQLEMETLMGHFKDYMSIGGMPEVVAMFVKNGHFGGTLKLMRQLLKEGILSRIPYEGAWVMSTIPSLDIASNLFVISSS